MMMINSADDVAMMYMGVSINVDQGNSDYYIMCSITSSSSSSLQLSLPSPIHLYIAPIIISSFFFISGQFAKIKVEFSPKDSEGGSEGEVEFISEIKGKARMMIDG